MQTPFIFKKKFDNPAASWAFLKYLSAHYKPSASLELVCRQETLTITLKAEDVDLSRLIEAYFNPQPAQAMVIMFCDGGSRGNPGPGACAYVLLDDQEKVLKQGGKYFEYCTNNQAEYWGLKMGVSAALAAGMTRLSIHMDSQLIVRQIKGEYKIKNKDLLPLYKGVKEDLAKMQEYKIVYVPRRYNQLADSLANQIMDENI